MPINHQSFLIIISSPSGAGKSTLCQMITQNDPSIKLSVSATTRTKREQEIEGKHYFFVTKEEFDRMSKNNEFLESAEVFGNHYGTPIKMVQDQLNKGLEVLFDIDWQGARQIKQRFDQDSVISIFILPPSISELKRRLTTRAQDSEEDVINRMKKSYNEISHFNEYDLVIINDDLNSTYQKIFSVIEAKRLQRYNKKDLQNFVNNFLDKNA
jgi:guanylate kinase